MPIKVVPRSDAKCRNAEAGVDDKPSKLFDGGGLFLQVMPHGSKLWRLKYRFAGAEKLLLIGAYPGVSLASASDERTRAKELLRKGSDPVVRRQMNRPSIENVAQNTLESLAREWHTQQKPGWADSHASKVLLRMEKNIFPWLASLPIATVTAPILLTALQRLERRGALDTARRLLQCLIQIFRYAIRTSRVEHNIATDLIGATAAPVVNKYASTQDPALLGRLLRDIDCYEGSLGTRTALALAPMRLCRPG